MESTARAERFELQSAALPAYSWEVPQKPVIVRIPFGVIDKLEGEAVETFRSLNARGSEIGGVLFGKASGGEPVLVSIEDYELIACDYTRGPLYRLSDADLGKFDRVIAQHAAAGSMAAVGFFRSHTRKGLALDAEDMILFESRFKDPRKVALLIRPFATKASSAGFFFWEGGAVHSESSYLEFPFRSSQLSTFKPSEVADAGLTSGGLGGVALPAPSVPKTAARAQIVPIASRREATTISIPALATEPPPAPVQPAALVPPANPAPAVEAAPPAAVVAAPPEIAAPAPAAPEPAAKSAVPESPAAAPAESPAPKGEATPVKAVNPPWNKTSSRRAGRTTAEPAARGSVETPAKVSPEKPATEKAASESIEKPVGEKSSAEKSSAEKSSVEKSAVEKLGVAVTAPPEVEPELAAGESPARSGKLLWLAIGAIVPLVLMVVLFIYPGVMRRGSKPSSTSGIDTSALSLRVERTGGELQLTWNRDSDPIRNATKAVLSISDGSQHQDVELDLAQLQKGSIAYTPATGDVVFRIEVTTKGQSKTASEMVRALSTRPSPMAEVGSPAGAPGATPPGKAPETAAVAPTPMATEPLTVAEEAGKTPQRVLKPFKSDDLSARLHPAPASTELPDAPSMGRVDGASVSVSALNLNSVSAPVAPPKAAPVAPPPPAAEKKMPAGGQIQQAVLIHRKEPEYPRLARETGAKGVVELTATIGADGKVKKVAVVRGHPMLVKAASDAVLQWTYRPTILNGVPVEAQTQVVINFMGDR